MDDGLRRVLACVLAALNLFLTYAVIVPWLVNTHNDGALMLAIATAIGVPAALYIGLRKAWMENAQ